MLKADSPPLATDPATRFIELKGVRTYNLKGFDVSIPLDRLTIITGVSGSGKSSLAFDTLFAEGQRRYVETFSAYSRQFLPPYEKPNVDRIDRIPPAIAVSQHRVTGRVTVASAAGLMDYLRGVYARSDQIICSTCQVAVEPGLPESVFDKILTLHPGQQVTIQFSPVIDPAVTWEAQWSIWRSQGFLRIELDGRVHRTDESASPAPQADSRVRVLLDRVKIDASQRGRFVESIEVAYRHGEGRAEFVIGNEIRSIFEQSTCSHCGTVFPQADANLFLPTNPESACLDCHGLGEIPYVDRAKVIPDPTLSMEQGGIAPLKSASQQNSLRQWIRSARLAGIDSTRPIGQLSLAQMDLLFHGEPSAGLEGVEPFFQSLRRQTYKPAVRQMLARFQSYRRCPTCQGDRFRREVLAYRLAGLSIADFLRLSIREARERIEGCMADPSSAEKWYRELLRDVMSRLVYLDDVGLGYLTLDRPARTLSGGESRRVGLATALGSRLAKTLFVLDEPTAGLHRHDIPRLWDAILSLRRLGNTVVLVEHETDWMQKADWLVDLGPGAGSQGGELLFEGHPQQLGEQKRSSPTSLFIQSKVTLRASTRLPSGSIRIRGASLHHLKNIDVDFPLGLLVAVAGVSGSGKSTLVIDTLHAALIDRDRQEQAHPGPYQSIEGYESIGEVIVVDDQSLGKTSRGNPATYLGFFDAIRELFANTADAKIRGLTKGDFSFNRPGGRCETCEGLGYLKFDMQFLPEARLTCSACHGRRFESRVRDIKCRGRSIDELLEATASEAFSFFRGEIGIQQRIKVLKDVGLGYLPIGQSLDTLSGGERQRLRLASFVSARPQKRCLFILEEPTTGIHPADMEPLLDTLQSLIAVGHSVIAIEHDVRFLAAADHLIELGPGAGAAGGEVIAVGGPDRVALLDTPTGRALASSAS